MVIRPHRLRILLILPFVVIGTLQSSAKEPATQPLKSRDLHRLRAVDDVALSADGHWVAYTVMSYDRPGRPAPQVWVMELVSRKSIRLGSENEATSTPLWSPDSKWLAYSGGEGDKLGLWMVPAPNSQVPASATFLAPIVGSNSPIPYQGRAMSWSPDDTRIAFVSAMPGPETADAGGDPIVITRYLYKPIASEGLTHFNDNRRLHVFVVDVATRKIRQLTNGDFDEHSIDWSPDGKEIVFASDREPNADEFFHYDLFALNVADCSLRRLTASEGCEYAPRWSPDGKMIAYAGTKRGLTDRETGMEDNHVWLMDAADGQKRREIGEVMDNFQGNPQWSPDSRAVYFTMQDRGSVHLERLRIAGGRASPEVVVSEPGMVGAISPGSDSTIAYAMATPYDMAELYLKREGAPSERLTNLNAAVLAGGKLADVHPFTFVSNDNKYAVEAFLTCPDAADTSKCPLIVSLHGGPHSQRGRTFNFKNQIYATRGWATLEVNYRGSTGYGQKFADACFGDLDGGEAQDVLYGVSAAVRRNPWIDRDRMGIEGFSYGGQLTEWLITQTNEFKAAIPTAGVANLISQNYMAYYNQYEEMEFGQFVHQGNLMDLLWDRSPLKHVASARTPTMFVHGENDPDVPIAEDEQLYIALKDVGVETVMVRYPREGHGLREAKHIVDSIDRSIAWYEAHFTKPRYPATTNVQP